MRQNLPCPPQAHAQFPQHWKTLLLGIGVWTGCLPNLIVITYNPDPITQLVGRWFLVVGILPCNYALFFPAQPFPQVDIGWLLNPKAF